MSAVVPAFVPVQEVGPGEALGPVNALASDGTVVGIRPVGPGDSAALRELHAGVSRWNSYLRFFTENAASADAYARRLTDPDPAADRLVLLAERQGRLVGVGSCEPLGAGAAEVAFLLDDRCHGLGIGTLLLEHLAAAARARGITVLRADVLAANHGMLRVFADSGFTERTTYGGGVVRIALDTVPTDLTLRQTASRQRHARAQAQKGGSSG